MSITIRSTSAAALGVLLAAAQIHGAAAGECTGSSGSRRVALLELYTSEGCDSCPPVDKWLSGLPAKQLTSERMIALAYHVDYWNGLGWADRFSRSAFSERQRRHARRRGASLVFTPQLLLNGQDYRRGILFDDIDTRIQSINRLQPQAAIRLQLTNNEASLDGTLEVTLAAGIEPRLPEIYVALYENDLATAVTGGENSGRTLKHDFVVRDLSGPLALDAKGRLRHEISIKLGADWKPRDLRLVAFVEHPQSGDILQALAVTCR